MPYPFPLPTTSTISFSRFFASTTHPSLLHAATTKRSLFKDALKKYKRLAHQARTAQLSALQDAVTAYIPYLLALNAASALRDVSQQRVEIEVLQPLEVEWRITLSATLPGREPPRQKLVGLHHEIAFTLSTLAAVHTLLARSLLKGFRDSTAMTTDQRNAAVAAAMKHLLEAQSVYAYLLALPSVAAASKDAPADIRFSTISALASLALAEATLIRVSQDDPYAVAVADDRNENVTDWMFKAPSIPKVRARLYAHICLAAADHARQASALMTRTEAGKLDESLVRYTLDLQRTARGKGIRFLAIDAELAGKTGEALAWISGAKKELGFANEKTVDGKRKGLRGLKQTWQERREDRKLEKGSEWGLDAGRFEELRVLEMLEAKWDRENNTINVQTVPPFEPLLAHLPSGREYHTPVAYEPTTLDAGTLAQMRAPPDPDDSGFRGDEEDSGGEDYGVGSTALPPGAFPGEHGYVPSATPASQYY